MLLNCHYLPQIGFCIPSRRLDVELSLDTFTCLKYSEGVIDFYINLLGYFLTSLLDFLLSDFNYASGLFKTVKHIFT